MLGQLRDPGFVAVNLTAHRQAPLLITFAKLEIAVKKLAHCVDLTTTGLVGQLSVNLSELALHVL